MSRSAFAIALAALLVNAPTVSAQNRQEVPEGRQIQQLPRQILSGPRFGFTTFTGDVARMRGKLLTPRGMGRLYSHSHNC